MAGVSGCCVMTSALGWGNVGTVRVEAASLEELEESSRRTVTAKITGRFV
jgi:hypothetical protein